MICSMRLDGSTACMTIEGVGDVVIMDNLCPHKSEPTPFVDRSIARAGAAVLFLPAYSPEFNPIEKMWSRLKSKPLYAALRHEPNPHSLKPSQALGRASPQDARNWFAHCGYSFL
jgi:hypothetical protein